jgi:hypothetical protein
MKVTPVHETDDIYRLYRREWVTVHTASGTAETLEPIFELAQKYYEDNLRDRVRDEEFRVTAYTDNAEPLPTFWVHVELFKENLKGEFKHAHAAERFARDAGWEEYTVVVRNSKDDHRIRNYGVTKL